MPHDGGTTYQPGARFAPYHVRRVSALVQGYHPVHGLDVFARLRCVDGGNVVFPPFDRAAMRAAVEAEVRQLAAAQVAPVWSAAITRSRCPCCARSRSASGRSRSSTSTRTSTSAGPTCGATSHHHGTPIRHAIDEGLVEAGQLYQLGIRGPRGGAADDVIARSAGPHRDLRRRDRRARREPRHARSYASGSARARST